MHGFVRPDAHVIDLLVFPIILTPHYFPNSLSTTFVKQQVVFSNNHHNNNRFRKSLPTPILCQHRNHHPLLPRRHFTARQLAVPPKQSRQKTVLSLNPPRLSVVVLFHQTVHQRVGRPSQLILRLVPFRQHQSEKNVELKQLLLVHLPIKFYL